MSKRMIVAWACFVLVALAFATLPLWGAQAQSVSGWRESLAGSGAEPLGGNKYGNNTPKRMYHCHGYGCDKSIGERRAGGRQSRGGGGGHSISGTPTNPDDRPGSYGN